MPLPPGCTNVTLSGTTLRVTYGGAQYPFELDRYLKNEDGKFVWDSTGGFSGSLRPNSLRVDRNGTLSAELRRGNRYVPATIDLGEKINVVDGEFAIRLRETTRPPPSPSTSDSPSLSDSPPPPAYNEFFEGFRRYKTDNFQSISGFEFQDYQERSSGWLKYSVETLTISGAGELTAVIRLPNGGRNSSGPLDLKNYIGVVGGKLVWGQRDFVEGCKPGSLKLIDKFTLQAECYTDKTRGQTEIYKLNLSRYLQVIDGELGVRVITGATGKQVSELLNGGNWKYRVVREAGVGILGEVDAFREAFHYVAEAVFKQVMGEVTEGFSDATAKQIRTALENTPQGEVVEIIKVESIVDQHVADLEKEVGLAFDEAKRRVLDACSTMKEKAIKEARKELSTDHMAGVEKALTSGVDDLMKESLREVSALAIAHFQESAAILMESELQNLDQRAARTQAIFLHELANEVECNVGIHTSWVNMGTNCTPAGAQTFPMTSDDLNQLIIQSQATGAFDVLYNVAFLCWLATLLKHLHTIAPSIVPELSGVALECLSTSLEPDWASFPVYLSYNDFYRNETDSPEHWGSHPTNIPSIHNAPKPDSPRVEWAEAIFVHFDSKRHLGVRMAINGSTGFAYMPTIDAFILYYSLSPLVPSTDRSSVPEFRTHLVTLLAIPGLYREILTKDSVDINPTRSISRCTREAVKSTRSLAVYLTNNCGITTDEADRYNVWALQYCLDVCRNPTFPEHMRFKYAQIFVHAQNRLLFHPLPIPVNDTYQFPSHWDISHISEHRRRIAVLNHWKNAGGHPKLFSLDYELPKLTYAPHNLPDTAVSGLANMNIDTGSVIDNQSTQGST
ncbi:hypothetical protein D9758_017683 [Tetrapyrgos nigripes]|uniref:Cyanovirin-N domain-containing protein n=1 Tax=Tetrapyrgos nigripes TaxID=182062 RepID=A0A8H5C7C0_9AGAR|nr:hypothetical protein D9758_017683 [Tetrapyrgos nigripes]